MSIYRMKICLSFTIFVLFVFTTNCNRPSFQDESKLTGFWEMQGYGEIMEINDTTINLYDLTKNTCVPVKTIPLKDIAEIGDVIAIEQASLKVKSGITVYTLSRIDKLPELCANYSITNSKDPEYNFDVFWNTFNEHYAFFKERNINWLEIYKQYRSLISQATTDRELYEMLSEIVDKFDDGHVWIDAPNDVSADEIEPTSVDQISKNVNISAEDLQKAIVKKYLTKHKSAGRGINGNALINWGITTHNIGYLQLNQMIFFLDYGLPDSILGNDFAAQYIEKSYADPNAQISEVKEVRKIMNEVVRDFKNVQGVILDIRLNSGGYDTVGLEVLSRFINKEYTAFSKKAKWGDAFTEKQYISLRPFSENISAPVMLLTSHYTASAAEIMALSTLSMKNVSRIGSRTNGILSDVLDKKLPNGWTINLSNEIYEGPNGELFENIGIPPTISLNYAIDEEIFRRELMNKLSKGDDAIEIALKKLR